jgi:hypothetical protein
MTDHRIYPGAPAGVDPGLAIGIAIGCSQPLDPRSWPPGLAAAWNQAAEAGAFDGAATIADLARAFLAHRAAEVAHLGAAP